MEGYVESAMSGLLVGISIYDEITGREKRVFSDRTVCGALQTHISTPNKDFQPMGANMGILPPLENHIRDKRERYAALSERGKKDIQSIAL